MEPTPTRAKIPQRIIDELMFINRHTCCICHVSRKHVQVHHIDSDSSNDSIDNLGVLCLDCHSIVTGDGGLGRRYSRGEVVLYKKHWQDHCSSDTQEDYGGEDREELTDSHYEDSILEGDSHLVFDYDLNADNEVSIWAVSNRPIHIIVMKHKVYKHWLETGMITSSQVSYENQREIETQVIVPDDGYYSILVINPSLIGVQIQLDISVWSD